MSRSLAKTRRNQIRIELRERFEKGERLTVDQVMREYFRATNELEVIMAKRMARSIMSLVGDDFKKEGVLFGSLDESGTYGIPADEIEFRYMGLKRYATIKGMVKSTEYFMRRGMAQGLIQAKEEPLVLLKPLETT